MNPYANVDNFTVDRLFFIPMLLDQSRINLTGDLNICRILNGMWQVAGGHGCINSRAAIAQMFDYVDAGFTTWDLADHYGAAEDFVGEFRQQWRSERGEAALSQVQALTKWVPQPGQMTRQIVEESIDRSRQRMQTQTLDLLQFHWQDYGDRRYLDALLHLQDLQQASKIRHLALTNFDTAHLQMVCDRGIQIVSNQVQFSLIDRRPLVQMAQFCQQHEIKLLAYGTLCGGLLSDRYLHQPEPSGSQLTTASQRKYKKMIDAWGGWNLLQSLLNVLHSIAQQHKVSIANVAVRWVLDQPTVAGAIVGARLSIAEHLQDNVRVFGLQLDDRDRAEIETVLGRSRDLFAAIGDCGDEDRHATPLPTG